MSETDVFSELLAMQLLADDLRNIASTKEAEELQLAEILGVSNSGASNLATKDTTNITSDHDTALQLFESETFLSRDRAYAESLQASEASVATNLQYAQSLAAAERKLLLDAEFARRLQQAFDENRSADYRSYDIDSLLGQGVVEDILASDPNTKGKSKSKSSNGNAEMEDGWNPKEGQLQLESGSATGIGHSFDRIPFDPQFPSCGICGDTFRNTQNPFSASQTPSSSSNHHYGLYLPCPNQHAYCLSCLISYIHLKLDPKGDGGGVMENIVFPIRCPECPAGVWEDGIGDEVARRILGEDGMAMWHSQKFLDSLPRLYCPNIQCSALVQVPEEANNPQAHCPACSTVMCTSCKTQWHKNLSCEEFQSLPMDERLPEDRLLLRLAKEKKWRRCPDCNLVIELAFGCNHMICRCGGQFCFNCGAPWDRFKSRCTRGSGCTLWEDEEMLLEEGERRRAPVQESPLLPPPAATFQVGEPSPGPIGHGQNRPRLYGEFAWMADRNIVYTNQKFTTEMIDTSRCGYCNSSCGSLAGLRHHLAHIKRHPVYSCCGRFFRVIHHFRQHTESKSDHHDQLVRNDDRE